jgi:predicted transglutaminase-like cysteine proteinase
MRIGRQTARDRHIHPATLLLILTLFASGCQTVPSAVPPAPEAALLGQVNAAVNRRGRPCPDDVCLGDWPEVADLEGIDYWDCKAYAVAKADRLIHERGYDPARLEYLLIDGPSLRVTHAALLVDGRWVLDNGLRCKEVCELARFVGDARVIGRLLVADLPAVRQALHQSSSAATGR